MSNKTAMDIEEVMVADIHEAKCVCGKGGEPCGEYDECHCCNPPKCANYCGHARACHHEKKKKPNNEWLHDAFKDYTP